MAARYPKSASTPVEESSTPATKRQSHQVSSNQRQRVNQKPRSHPSHIGRETVSTNSPKKTDISRGSYHDRANFTENYHDNYDDSELNVSYFQQTRSGEAVYFSSSKVSPEPNSTALRQAESQLRFILLTLPGGNSKAAICTRVDPSIDDVEVSPVSQRAGWDEDKSGDSGDGGDGEDGDGGDDDSSAAGPRFATTISSVGIVGLAVAFFGLF